MTEVNPSTVQAVGVSALLGYLFLDNRQEPLGNAQIWMDGRASREVAELKERIGQEELYRRTGRRITPELLAPKLLWMNRHRPDTARRISQVIGLKDEILRRLTGRVITDVAHLDYTLLWNGRESRADKDLLREVGYIDGLLPRGCRAQERAGAVHASAARATGLSEGTPVIVGTSDGTAAMYGGGIVRKHRAVLVSGTTDVLMTLSAAYPEDASRVLSINSGMVPGTYALGGALGLSGGTLMRTAELVRGNIQDLLEKAALVPPGSEGLLAAPGLSGERAPYWEDACRGGLFGLRLDHGAEHILRAVMEGTAYRLKRLLEIIKDTGTFIDGINIVGGGARNDVWNQIRADVLGSSLERLRESEATTLGIALFCRAFAEDRENLEGLASEWNPKEKIFHPRREAESAYRRWSALFEDYLETTRELTTGLSLLTEEKEV